ncbi:unnamed protein product [Gordionus sp. m RMFG-2023]
MSHINNPTDVNIAETVFSLLLPQSARINANLLTRLVYAKALSVTAGMSQRDLDLCYFLIQEDIEMGNLPESDAGEWYTAVKEERIKAELSQTIKAVNSKLKEDVGMLTLRYREQQAEESNPEKLKIMKENYALWKATLDAVLNPKSDLMYLVPPLLHSDTGPVQKAVVKHYMSIQDYAYHNPNESLPPPITPFELPSKPARIDLTLSNLLFFKITYKSIEILKLMYLYSF